MNNDFKNFNPFLGFEDKFGPDLELSSFIVAKLFELFRLFGYEQIEVPIIEKKKFFTREYVGDSPWPGWDERCLFETRVIDYQENYNSVKEAESAALTPEGTLSICRWLASHILTKKSRWVELFPLKLYYQIKCFRNEPIPDLSQNKRREFGQIGLEIFGPSSELADIEVLYLIPRGMEILGIPKERIIIRIGDVRIFNHLSGQCGLNKKQEVFLKEKLDRLAELKALKLVPESIRLRAEIISYLENVGVSSSLLELWKKLCSFEINDLEKALSFVENDLNNKRIATSLRSIKEMMEFLKISFGFDFCVIRGQEYYTGPVFEVDFWGEKTVYLEIAGGGRYDQLISRFLKDDSILVPATGFAFGLERILNILKIEGTEKVDRQVRYFLDGKGKDFVVFPENIKKAWEVAEKMRGKRMRTDLYFLDDNKNKARRYAQKKGARFLRV